MTAEVPVSASHIPRKLDGKGLGRALGKLRPELSYGALQGFARKGRILLNGKKAHLGTKVHTGDRVEIRAPTGVAANPGVAFTLLHEDPGLLVVAKPADVASLPGPGCWRTALACGLVARFPELRALPDCGFGHRLDKPTSGLLAVARDAAVLERLRAAFKERRVGKRYLALCLGYAPASGELTKPLAERRRGPHLRAVVARRGKSAHTVFRRLAKAGGTSLLEVEPRTGRFHQIRAHLADLGFPVAGDPLYGVEAENRRLAGKGLARLFLHARQLSLPAELGGTTCRAPLPGALREALAGLGFRLEEEPCASL